MISLHTYFFLSPLPSQLMLEVYVYEIQSMVDKIISIVSKTLCMCEKEADRLYA